MRNGTGDRGGQQVTQAEPGLHELFMLRMEIVQEIARLNSRQLYDRQLIGGCEVEVMRCERDAALAAATADGALAAARERYEAALATLQSCEDELASWHARLDELDRKIAEN